MVKRNYYGIELVAVTETKVYDEPHEMFVWNNEGDEITKKAVCAIIPYRHSGSVITTGGAYSYCAEIPEKPIPRLATNRELARWIAQGNGEFKQHATTSVQNCFISYEESYGDKKVADYIRIRKWDDTEWHVPTVDYLGIERTEDKK